MDWLIVDVPHDFPPNPCGQTAYRRVYGEYYSVFDGHLTLDGSTHENGTMMRCGSCGEQLDHQFWNVSHEYRQDHAPNA